MKKPVIFGLTVVIFLFGLTIKAERPKKFAPGAVSFNDVVSSEIEADKEILELMKRDYGKFVYNDDKEVVAYWLPVSNFAEKGIKAEKSIVMRERHGFIEILVRNEKSPIDGRYLLGIKKTDQNGTPGISLELDAKGGELLKAFTKSVIERAKDSGKSAFLAFVIDEKIYAAPTLVEPIGKEAVITFSPSPAEREKLEKEIDGLIKKVAELPRWEFAEKINEWKSIYDGKTLDGWEAPSVGGEGEVVSENGCIVLNSGATLTAVRYTKPFPKLDYEIEYEARKTMGTDFFAALTFPVGRSYLTFINGGWGGGVVGLSNIDGYDAANNETATFMNFKKDRWYRFRVRVVEGKIQCWVIDDSIEKETEDDKREQLVIDKVIIRHKVDLRSEADILIPLGFGTWVTTGEIKNIRFRMLTAEESEELNREAREYADKFAR